MDQQGTPHLNKDTVFSSEFVLSFDLCRSVEDRISITNESLKFRVSRSLNEILLPMTTIIDTKEYGIQSDRFIFGSEERCRWYISNKEDRNRVLDLLSSSFNSSRSFIFLPETIQYLTNRTDIYCMASYGISSWEILSHLGDYELGFFPELTMMEYKRIIQHVFPLIVISALNRFGGLYLYVIDTKLTGLTNLNSILPLHLWTGNYTKGIHSFSVPIEMNNTTLVPNSSYERIVVGIKSVSSVLGKIVPGLSLSIVDYGTVIKENAVLHSFNILSVRNGVSIPLSYESDGIKRIISILSILSAAYNNESVTVAIDEIDSGIYEFLLGEILSVMADSMKGQLIFTSHNFRALEILPAKYICFTTTEPTGRFLKVSNRGNSNLRDTYYRGIILDTFKHHVYEKTDKYEIEKAFLMTKEPIEVNK